MFCIVAFRNVVDPNAIFGEKKLGIRIADLHHGIVGWQSEAAQLSLMCCRVKAISITRQGSRLEAKPCTKWCAGFPSSAFWATQMRALHTKEHLVKKRLGDLHETGGIVERGDIIDS